MGFSGDGGAAGWVSGVVLLYIMGNTNQFQRQGSVAAVEAFNGL